MTKAEKTGKDHFLGALQRFPRQAGIGQASKIAEGFAQAVAHVGYHVCDPPVAKTFSQNVEGQGFVRVVHDIQHQQFECLLHADITCIKPILQVLDRPFPLLRVSLDDRLDYIFLAFEQAVDLADRHLGGGGQFGHGGLVKTIGGEQVSSRAQYAVSRILFMLRRNQKLSPRLFYS